MPTQTNTVVPPCDKEELEEYCEVENTHEIRWFSVIILMLLVVPQIINATLLFLTIRLDGGIGDTSSKIMNWLVNTLGFPTGFSVYMVMLIVVDIIILTVIFKHFHAPSPILPGSGGPERRS